MKRLMNHGLFLALTLGLTTPALAGDNDATKAEGAAAFLARVDANETANTAEFKFTMTLTPKSGSKRVIKFSVWQRNRTQRLTEFTEPGELKGMRILARGGNKMWVYSPQTDNVRRVAAHAQRQPVLGSDITYEDMGESSLAANYDAAFAEDKGGHQWMELKKKADASASWEKLRIRVDKKLMMFDRVEYFEKGEKIRLQVREEPKNDGGKMSFRKLTIKDLKSGHETELRMDDQAVKKDLPATMFIKRNLVRGQ